MKKTPFSKVLAIVILAADVVLSAATLGLCYLAVLRDFSGSLPYLTALIGLYQGATGYVIGKYMDKSKAENTKGGIIYDTAINSERDC
ncbi:MAG: hypothetical protein QMB62_07870 [Oscillospiraceae bacterium]